LRWRAFNRGAAQEVVMALSLEGMVLNAPETRQALGLDWPADEEEVRVLMRDPRYWRDRDPAIVARVREGFRRLYPGSSGIPSGLAARSWSRANIGD
jgi:hypothetical protein